MRTFHAGFSFVLAIILSLTVNGPTQADAIDDYIRQRMAKEHIPGLSLVVVQKGKIVKAKGYGFANLEHRVPAKPETVYGLASTTKPFTAAAILLLIQEGKLTLDTKISPFVENAPDTWKEITVRHLLSHTSGIHNYLGDPPRKDFPHDTPVEEIVKWAKEVPLDFAPGERWAYSNTGFVLLGMIVQKVSGKPYDVLLKERVFASSGMTHTVRSPADALISDRATGYLWFGGTFHNADFLKYMITNYGDTGLFSSALDLAKWDAVLSTDDILTTATKTAMWTPVIRFDVGYSEKIEYGLGWFLRTIHGHRQISHPGGSPGMGAIFSRYPDDDLSVIILANGGNGFMQALDIGVAKHYIPGLIENKSIALPATSLRACTGYYNAFGGQVLTVTNSKLGIFVDDGAGINNEFLPVSDTVFVSEEADRGVTIARDKQGNAVGGTIRFGSGTSPIFRIGPLTGNVKPQADPDPALTARIEAVLKAFAAGGKAVEEVPSLAPGARKDYASGPAPELAGIRRISYLDTFDIAAQDIERHGAKVDRVLYFRLFTTDKPRFVLVYLTTDGLVTDQDVL